MFESQRGAPLLRLRWESVKIMAEISVKPNQGRGVECDVSSSIFCARKLHGLCTLIMAAWFATALTAAPVPELPPPTFGQLKPLPGVKVPVKPPSKDELVYKDGDRVKGRYIDRQGDMLVFQSDRFGVLRVPSTQADVVLAKKEPTGVATGGAGAEKANEDTPAEHWPFSPLALARELKEFFGSWHGRFSFAAEMMKDRRQQNSGTGEAHLGRKWPKDEVQLSARYDYATVDESIPSTDMVKGAGVWRHDLPRKMFALYRPTLEWNRAYYRLGKPADYVLLQQEIGVGVSLISTDTKKVRLGVSENLFDTWLTVTDDHISQTTESVFAELEARLPWRIIITDRGVWYYSIVNNTEGWENRFEVNKKLTETLTMGLRHEIRHNNPDVRSADYQRLRLLFGFDF